MSTLKLRIGNSGVTVLNAVELYISLKRMGGTSHMPLKLGGIDTIIAELEEEYETTETEVLSDYRDILAEKEKVLITAEQVFNLIPELTVQPPYEVVTVHPPDGHYDHWYGYLGLMLHGEYNIPWQSMNLIIEKLNTITGPEWSSVYKNQEWPFLLWKQDGPRSSHRKFVQETLPTF